MIVHFGSPEYGSFLTANMLDAAQKANDEASNLYVDIHAIFYFASFAALPLSCSALRQDVRQKGTERHRPTLCRAAEKKQTREERNGISPVNKEAAVAVGSHPPEEKSLSLIKLGVLEMPHTADVG